MLCMGEKYRSSIPCHRGYLRVRVADWNGMLLEILLPGSVYTCVERSPALVFNPNPQRPA